MKVTIVKQNLPSLAKYKLEIPDGCTVAQALACAKLVVQEGWSVSIWTEMCTRDTNLNDGDRIEICEPLRVDPKKARMLRAKYSQEKKLGSRRHAKQK